MLEELAISLREKMITFLHKILKGKELKVKKKM